MENCPKSSQKKSLNGCSVGVQLILLAPLETFNLTSGKQFLHKLKIIQSKLCKYIRSDKGGGGVVVYCEVKKSEPVVETELRETLLKVCGGSACEEITQRCCIISKSLRGRNEEKDHKQQVTCSCYKMFVSSVFCHHSLFISMKTCRLFAEKIHTVNI